MSSNAVTADMALSDLISGHKRFLTGKVERCLPNMDVIRKYSTYQAPPVAVLSCADSRVPPELIFDQGVGDIFVVRVAGNIVNPDVIASLHFAVENLGVKMIVVMGHTKCGAVKGAVGHVTSGAAGSPTGNGTSSLSFKSRPAASAGAPLVDLLETIRPAVESTIQAYKDTTGDDLVETVVRVNAAIAAAQVLEMLIEQVSPGKMEGVKVAPAVYSLETGQVAWLDWEKKLRSVACMSGADHAFLEEVFSKHRNHLADGPKLAAEAGAPRDSAEALMAA